MPAARCSGAPATSWGRRYRCCRCWRAPGPRAVRQIPGATPSSGCCAASWPPTAARTCRPRWPSSCWRWSAEQCAVLPTVLVIDDLQWADQASVALWGRLARAVQQMPLLLIGTMRPVPQRDDLLALRRAVGDAVRLQLTGLAEAAVAELVAALAGGAPGRQADAPRRRRRGQSALRHRAGRRAGRNSSLAITDAGTAELLSGPAPSSLSAAIADRLDFVSGPVREVLQAAALLGVDFAVPDLATVLGRGVADLVPAVDGARAAGVLAESGSGLGFRHPLIRAALYDVMPAPVRAAWHRDAGRRAGAGRRPGGPGGPAAAVGRGRIRRPVRADGRVDPELAGPHLGARWSSRPPGWPRNSCAMPWRARRPASAQHDYLSGRLADALYRIGEMAEAEQVANRALVHAAEPDLIIDLHWTLAQCSIQAGRSAESLATLNRALAAPGIAARHRARLLVLAARTHSYSGEVEKAGRVATSALAAATEAGDTWAMGWALHVLSIVTAVQGAVGGRAGPVRPGADRDPGRSGPDRPAAAAADQQGHHAGQPGPVRGGPGRGPGGAAPGGPGRHDHPAGPGARRPGPAAVRDRALGRGDGRGRGRPARGPEGAGHRLRRPGHRRRHLLPSRRGRAGPPSPRGGRLPRRAARQPGDRARWRWPAAWTPSTTARCPRRWPS